jgi:hypothetical protein
MLIPVFISSFAPRAGLVASRQTLAYRCPGGNEQLLGAKEQDPHEEQSYLRMRRLDAGYLDELV